MTTMNKQMALDEYTKPTTAHHLAEARRVVCYHYARITGRACPDDVADDLAQTLCLDVFRRNRGYPAMQAIRAFAWGIVMNHQRNANKKASRIVVLAFDPETQLDVADECEPDDDRAGDLAEACNYLSQHDRVVVGKLLSGVSVATRDRRRAIGNARRALGVSA